MCTGMLCSLYRASVPHPYNVPSSLVDMLTARLTMTPGMEQIHFVSEHPNLVSDISVSW